ncbi:MAG: hypothetical protein U0165_06955 [Polyangiaceae bacterium]
MASTVLKSPVDESYPLSANPFTGRVALMRRTSMYVVLVALLAGCAASGASGPSSGSADSAQGKPANSASSSSNTTSPSASSSAGSGNSGSVSTAASSSTASAPASSNSTPSALSTSGTSLPSVLPSKTTAASGDISVRVLDAKQLEPGEVSRSLQLTQLQWNRCYEPIFKKQPTGKIRTVLNLTIDAAGKLKTVAVKEDELKDATALKCIETALKGGSWPKPTTAPGTSTVELTVLGK